MEKELKRILEKLNGQVKDQEKIKAFNQFYQLVQFKERLERSGLTHDLYIKGKGFKFLEFSYLDSKGNAKHTREILNEVKRWLKEEKVTSPFLILHGKAGTGKTMLALKLLCLFFDNRYSVFWLEKKYFDMMIYRFQEKDDFLEMLMDVQVLVIDDFGTGYETDYRFSMLFTVLDHRYLRDKITILTMNNDTSLFRAIDETKTTGAEKEMKLLWDRLQEKGKFINFDYPSLRNKQYRLYASKNNTIIPLQRGETSNDFHV